MPVVAGIHYLAHPSETHNLKRLPVILVHGAGGNCLSWPPQIRRLPEQPVYALDLPGHGKSEGVGRQTIEDYAKDLHAFLDSLGLRSVVLVGISMGGAIALVLALQHPSRVTGLVLLGSGPKLRVATSTMDALSKSHTFKSAVDSINENCFSAGVSPRIKELSREIMLQMRQTVMQGDFLACDRFDATARLHEVRTPTLIVCGSEDRMTPPKHSQFLKDSIDGAELHIVEGAGHMVMAEQPDVVADMLARFIEGLGGRSRAAVSRKTRR